MTYPQPPYQPQAQGVDPFSDPENSGGGGGKPTLRTLGVGRLVVIVPLEKHRDTPNQFFKADKPVTNSNSPTRTYVVADVLICDGHPFMYGGNPTEGTPDTLGPFPAPGVIYRMEIDKKPILDDIPETQIGGGVIIARIVKQAPKGSGNPYWVLSKVTPQDRQIARPVYDAYVAKTLPTHVPPPKPDAAPAAAPGQPTYGYPAGAVPQAPQMPPGMVPTPYGMAPVTDVHPAYAAAVSPNVQQQMPYGPMGGQAAAMNPANPQWPTPYGQPPQAAVQSGPPAPEDVPAPGWNAAQWAGLSEVQKQMVRTQAAQQGAQPTYR